VKRFFLLVAVFAAGALLAGCTVFRVNLLPSAQNRLKEVTLQGKASGKVAVISISGTISGRSRKGLLRDRASMVQEVVSRLKLAQKDKQVKAVVLKIDTPGGTASASDILYHEIMAYKRRSGAKVVAAMMGLATSGGYYVSLAADAIYAHPTTVTGSIGVIFLQPKAIGLMKKIGVDVDVSKSGPNKDMASPFRRSTAEERRILQALTHSLADQFLHLVAIRRHLLAETLAQVATARIYLAADARKLGLIDAIGYLPDAIDKAKELAGLDPACKVVAYQRRTAPDGTVYSDALNRYAGSSSPGPRLSLWSLLPVKQPGFYYLWLPGLSAE